MFLPVSEFGSIVHVDEDDTWSPERLKDEVARRLPLLRRLGVAPGRRVLIFHGGSGEFFADLFAVWHLGGCAACLNPALTGSELANIADFIEATLILVRSGSAAPPDLSIPAVCTSEEAEILQAVVMPIAPEGTLDDEALILFTSGTTGVPKGVVHSYRSLLARTCLNRQIIGDDALARSLCVLPTHFGHGLIGNCLTPLFAGQQLLLTSSSSVQLASRLGAIVDRFGITFMSSVPTFWKLAGKASAPPSGGSLRRVHVGSAPLSSDLWNEIIAWSGTRDVVNMYGITETANWIGGASAALEEPLDGAVGRVWGGHAMVRTEDNQWLATGEGEILVQTPSLMTGYYKLPDLTREVLQGGWFCTGDVGRVEKDGSIRLTGRSKYEINRAGMKVHPEDIDLLLERHDGVREACAFGYADDVAGELVAVAVCASDGVEMDLKELKSWCSSRLVREKVPDKWFLVDEIPKTDRGKINRDVVAAHCFGTID